MFGLTGAIKYIAIAIAIGIGLSLIVLAAPILPIIVYLAILFNVMKLLWNKLKNLWFIFLIII